MVCAGIEDVVELEQFSEMDIMLGGAKGDIQLEADMVMPCSDMGVRYPVWLVDALFSTPKGPLLLLRVRGRPARRAGL